MMEQGPHAIRRELGDWMIEKFEGRDIVFFKGKNYIPQDDNLRRDVTKLFHDHETAGHPGELETYNALRQHYWWPGLRTYVKNYVCVDVVLVNNLKSTDPCPDPLTFLLKDLYRRGCLQTARWTSSRTCHQSTGLILFWSW